MGLTERHWFENEEPELTEWQLEDIVYENKKAYERGYQKGYSDRDKEIIRCKDCVKRGTYQCPVYVGGDGMCSEPDDWYCTEGEKRE